MYRKTSVQIALSLQQKHDYWRSIISLQEPYYSHTGRQALPNTKPDHLYGIEILPQPFHDGLQLQVSQVSRK